MWPLSKTNKLPKKTIAVIGGGWAGAAAVAELTLAGHQVDWYEASRQLGGRARAVEVEGKILDNGQHILLGAYSECLTLLKRLGLDPDELVFRLPLQMVYPNDTGMRFIAPKLPAPLHLAFALLKARGLDKEDKLALARFSTTARWMDWQLNVDCSVSELLNRFQQTPRLVELMWRPLCIAALNTLPEHASAKIFLAVLRDSLGAKRNASDMLLPKTDLSRLLPDACARLLQENGGRVFLGARIDLLEQHASFWRVRSNTNSIVPEVDYDAVILATPAEISRRLLAATRNSPTPATFTTPNESSIEGAGENSVEKLVENISQSTNHFAIPHFEYEAIATCYLQYSSDLRLARPFFALRDNPSARAFGQFVFDRGQLQTDHAGLLAVVISAPQEDFDLPHAELSKLIALQLANNLKLPALEHPLWSRIITEKRATFRCTPNLERPQQTTVYPHLFLAGDYTYSDYPATLETAVRSGITAARLASA